MMNSKLPGKISKQNRLKLATSVSCDLRWNTEMAYPIIGEFLSGRLCQQKYLAWEWPRTT